MVWCHWLLQRSESFWNRGAFKLGPASNFCMFDFRGCFLYLPGYHPVLGNLSQIVTNNSVFVPRTLKKNIYIYIYMYIYCIYFGGPMFLPTPSNLAQVTNKLAITAFPYESTLTALQMAFAVLLLLCFAFRSSLDGDSCFWVWLKMWISMDWFKGKSKPETPETIDFPWFSH